MRHILIMGAGKIGSLIACLLSESNEYKVFLADSQIDNTHTKRLNTKRITLASLNADDAKSITAYIKEHDIHAIVSSLPFYCNIPIAKIAAAEKLHYFDLAEDVATTLAVEKLSKNAKSAFAPQCGLAPGFISIIANHLMTQFEDLDTVKLRVGALPINISNALQYTLTWSTDGLINEYGNTCNAIRHGKQVDILPLEGVEEIKIDGLTYEAFNTSGGIGSLVNTYDGRVKFLSYKTIRYPGHCSKIKFLMNDLKLNENRPMLKTILENAIPKTYQDVVLVYVSVSGNLHEGYVEKNYVRKFYPKTIADMHWSAIQVTTSSGICAVVDMVLNDPNTYHGFIRQEQFSYEKLIANRFGNYFDESN